MDARLTIATATVLAVLAALGSACTERAQQRPAPQAEPAVALVGIDPREFDCATLITVDELGAIARGRARVVSAAAPTPIGVASPCTYVVQGEGGPGPEVGWTFDLDCRDGMQARAEALFEQYVRTSAQAQERIAAVPPKNAAPAPTAAAREVDVGARALDHHGQGLLFIDDDAPCYVRVVGPDADARLALAQHLARTLTPNTAPMTRRPAKSAGAAR